VVWLHGAFCCVATAIFGYQAEAGTAGHAAGAAVEVVWLHGVFVCCVATAIFGYQAEADAAGHASSRTCY
jgi:hypothetical protein